MVSPKGVHCLNHECFCLKVLLWPGCSFNKYESIVCPSWAGFRVQPPEHDGGLHAASCQSDAVNLSLCHMTHDRSQHVDRDVRPSRFDWQ